MSLKKINARLQKIDPCVELVKGDGYHYFTFDNLADESTLSKPVLKEGSVQIFEDESVYITYTSHWSDDRWVEEGRTFSQKMRAKHSEQLA